MKNWTFIARFGLMLAWLAWAGIAQAQVSPALYDYARPTLDWYTIETEHFTVHFHAAEDGTGGSRSAQVVARIAEEIYEPITSLYQHEPDTRVAIILKDFEDYSNGAAYFFDNKIELWLPSLESPLRGSHNWLRNVVTHEFTHIVQVQKTIKTGRRMPIFYLQWLAYEDVKRPDVLYGYPSGIVSYPIPALSNPAWFAEGTAQFQRFGLQYDRWDSHRDMLLRTMLLDDAGFSLEDMGGFLNKTGLQREQVYNHGFAFTHYLANTFGEDALRAISASLSEWDNWNIERAIEDATGTPGTEAHAAWMHSFQEEYFAQTQAIREHIVEGRLIEADGFSNAYPKFSPDGRNVAYISNRGEDFNLLSLYVVDLEEGITRSFPVDGLQTDYFALTCSHLERLKTGVGGTFSWHPDGTSIVFARTKDTSTGSLFSDLYELNLESGDTERLTDFKRAAAPAFAPDGRTIAFVVQGDGSTNLYALNLDTEETTSLTGFEDGTQVTDPVWHPDGNWVYFGLQRSLGRDLYRVRADGTGLEAVVETRADERSPAFDETGQYLYYTSDATGIYNLYRRPAAGLAPEALPASTNGQPDGTLAAEEGPSDDQAEQLTNVVGGAFMPDVSADGRVVYAHYQADGYKIAVLDQPETLPAAAAGLRYESPRVTQKPGPSPETFEWTALNAFDDTDLKAFPADVYTSAVQQEGFPVKLEGGAPGDSSTVEPARVTSYKNEFTSFGFYPVVRFDMYAKPQRGAVDAQIARRFQGGRLWRNTKVGFYAGSREVLEGLSIFGGLMVGPGSVVHESLGNALLPANVLKLERDLVLQFEYKKGLGILPKRWSPQIGVEMYNIRRNVQNGLSIEEFPCTACYPDTTYTDIAYTLWEGDVFLRSKVNRATLIELGYRWSPYRVRTESFFSREFGQTIEGSSSRYFIGHGLSAKAYFEWLHPNRHSEVVPHGLRAELGYEYQPGRLLDAFEIEDGLLVPQYNTYRIHQLLADLRYFLRFRGTVLGGSHGIGLRVRGSTVPGGAVDDFFDDYVGGLIGARGYPFYALGGNETLWFQASYLFPIVPDLNRQFLFLYATKLYGRVYADAAAAWSTGGWPGLGTFRKDVGAELRLQVGSFYLFPTALFLSATYGLDAFDFQLDEGFLTPEGSNTVRYGREWLWHFGVLFNFDL